MRMSAHPIYMCMSEMVARVFGFPTAAKGKQRLWEQENFINYTLLYICINYTFH